MIGKTAKFGANFLGALEYCYYAVLPNRSLNRTQVRGELLYYQHMAPGLLADPNVANIPTGERLHIEAIARQFAEIARRNERVEKPVWHQVFSFPVEQAAEGNTVVGRSTMVHIAQDFARAFGLVNNPMVVFRHSEKDHDHFHIIASRVDLDGKNSAQSTHNFRRVGQFCREMETKYTLTPTQPMLSLQSARTEMEQPQHEIHGAKITNTPNKIPGTYPTRRSLTADHLALRQAIDRAVLASCSLDDFCDRLAADSPYYVLFVPYTTKGGHEREGISYGLQVDRAKRATPGYALGRDYVFGHMVQRISGRTNSITLGQSPVPTTDKNSGQNGIDKIAKVVGDLAPSLPFAGTAARHESDWYGAPFEHDIARITRSLHETTSQPPENAGGKPTKGVLPKPPVRKPKRRKGL